MVIALNTISLFEEEKNLSSFFEIFSRLIHGHPADQFIFILKPDENRLAGLSGKNVHFISPGIMPEYPLRARLWLSSQLKKIIKEQQVDLLIHDHLYHLKAEIPQIVFCPNVNFINQSSFVQKPLLKFLRKKSAKIFSKTKNIVVFSLFEKRILKEKFPESEEKISVVYEGANSRKKDLGFEEREELKEQFAGGNEFFIYSGIISSQKNLVNLLKAFSAFKKRQRSGMQLLIIGEPGLGFEEFSTSLKTYKFKEEVKLLQALSPEEQEDIMAAAYALIIPSMFETSANAAFFAMQNNLPVIAPSHSIIEELCSDAGIYFDSTNVKDIAEKMMWVFKDEDGRNQLIKKGNSQIQLYDWDKSAALVSGIIFG